MFKLSRLKILFVIITLICIILFSLPSLVNSSKDKNNDNFLSIFPTINLGLDLKGGSHLLLEIDSNLYFKEQYNNYKDEFRKEFRKKHIKYTNLRANKDNIQFTTINDKVAEADITDIIKNIGDFDISVKDNEYIIRLSDYKKKNILNKLIEQSITIIQRRIDETGTKEPLIQREGENKILLQIAGINNPEEVKNLLGKTAKLTFQLVDNKAFEKGLNSYNTKYMNFMEEKGKKLPINKKILLTGENLMDAQVVFQEKYPAVSFKLNNIGSKKFAEITRNNIGSHLAIILDDNIISAPMIREVIAGGSGVISGNFNIKEASELALLLRAGALPAPLKIIEERTVGPNLGADSIEAGKNAAIIGTLIVVLFMIWTYGLFGFFADIALAVNILATVAIMSILGATLTMPGIAGMVLTIGMAVDANVLIFERIREEYKAGHSVYKSCELGFSNAYRAILDSNITTLITSALLYYFGSGAIRGFSVTLSIGILASMFSAILLTRLFIIIWINKAKPKKLFI